MERIVSKKIIAFLVSLCSSGLAQTASQTSPTYQDHRKPGTAVIEHDLPGVQQRNHSHPRSQAANPAQELADLTPAPDLLKDIVGRPPLRLEQFQQLALGANPTLRQASAL